MKHLVIRPPRVKLWGVWFWIGLACATSAGIALAQPYARLAVEPIPNPDTLPSCDAADENSWLLDVGSGETLRCEAGQWVVRAVGPGLQGPAGPQGEPGPEGPQGPPGSGGSPCDAWPVDSIFVSATSTSPATSLGCGTWEAFGAGRVLIGIDATQPEFDTAGETGGVKEHALTVAELPAHTHIETSNNTTTGPNRGWGSPDTSTNNETATGYSTQSTGGGVAHTNLQPYIAVFFWRRTG